MESNRDFSRHDQANDAPHNQCGQADHPESALHETDRVFDFANLFAVRFYGPDKVSDLGCKLPKFVNYESNVARGMKVARRRRGEIAGRNYLSGIRRPFSHRWPPTSL